MERTPAELVAGDLTIDLNTRRVIAGSYEINLTAKEFDILVLLARHPGWVWSQEQILEEVWGTSAFMDARVIAVHIGNLRAKLRPAVADRVALETVRGAGYRLQPTPRATRRSATGGSAGGVHPLAGSPSPAPPPNLSFVGRAAEIALLDGRYSSLVDQRKGGAILLYGEAGIGKSSLAQEWSERLSSEETLIVRACCRSEAPAFHPWGEVLQKLHNRAKASAVGELDQYVADFAELVSSGESADGKRRPSDIEVEPARSRFRLFSQVTGFLRRIAEPQPVVVILDDVDQANEATLGLLEFLAPEVRTIPLLLVLAIREQEPERNPALARAVDVLQRHGHADWIQLEGFSEDEARSYAGHLLGSLASPDLLDSLYQETDGNPLYFTEVVRSLLAGRTWRSGVLRVPRDDRLRLLVGQRLAGLSAACRAMVDAASVLREESSASMLSAVMGDSPAHCLELVDQAVSAGVLLPADEHRVRFRHLLFREVVYEGLGARRRAELHAAAALALEQTLGASADERLAVLAHHYLSGWPATGWEPTVGYGVAAGQQALGRLAWEDAVAYFARARSVLEMTPGPPSLSLALEVYEGLAGAQDLVGAYGPAEEALLAALRLGSEDSRTRSRLWAKLGHVRMGGRHLMEALDAFTAAEGELGDEVEPGSSAWASWVTVQTDRAWIYYYQGDVPALSALLERLRPSLEAYGDPAQRAWLYAHLATLALLRDHHQATDETLSYMRRHAEILQSTGRPELLCAAEQGLGLARMLRGELDQADTHFARGVELARGVGDRRLAIEMLSQRNIVARLRGDTEAVHRLAEELEEHASQGDWPEHHGVAQANLGWLAWKAGDLGAARERAIEATVGWRAFPAFPSQWMAHLVLLAIAVEGRRTAAGVLSAREMMLETQQTLPPELTRSLANAVESWEGGRRTHAQRALQAAVSSSQGSGFL